MPFTVRQFQRLKQRDRGGTQEQKGSRPAKGRLGFLRSAPRSAP